MADNTSQIGSDNIATDDLSTQNGSAVSGVKVQRMKIGFGVDGDLKDVTPNLGLPIAGSQPASLVTGSYTSSTGTAGTTLATPINGYNTVSVGIVTTTTVTAGVLTFEVSLDNTNWFPVALNRIDVFTAATTHTLAASQTIAYSGSVDAFNYFRIRISTAFAGTGTLNLALSPQTFPIEPTVTVGQSTAGSLNANVNIQGTPSFYMAGRNTGGATMSTLISAASTNATSVKTSAATLYGIAATNNTTTNAYLKIYNKASAPTVGTDTPAMTVLLAPNNTTDIDIPYLGVALGTGLAFAITGAQTVADTTAVAAGQCAVNLYYV